MRSRSPWGSASSCAAAASVLAAACANLSGLNSGSPVGVDAGAADTGSAADAQGPTDHESGAGDGESPADASAGVDAGSWCMAHPNHTHCFDFDTVGTVGVGWNNLPFTSGGVGMGAVALDTKIFDSPPASAVASVANGMDHGGTYAALEETLPSDAGVLVLAADIRTDLGDASVYAAGSGAALLGINYSSPASPGGDYSAGVGVGPHGPSVSYIYPTAKGYGSASYALPAFPSDSAGWTRIVLTLTLASPWGIEVSFNGVTEAQFTIAGSVALSTPAVLAIFGVIAVGGETPLVVHYDNVTIDVQ